MQNDQRTIPLNGIKFANIANTVIAPTGEAPIEAPRAREFQLTVRKVDSLGRAYGTGKRKDAIARVWIKDGSGAFVVNGKRLNEYFNARSANDVVAPFHKLDVVGKFDVFSTVSGGGFTGQSGALRHAISRALLAFEPMFKPNLRAGGFLTRDSRTVEPKKYGLRKARRATQFSKR